MTFINVNDFLCGFEPATLGKILNWLQLAFYTKYLYLIAIKDISKYLDFFQ